MFDWPKQGKIKWETTVTTCGVTFHSPRNTSKKLSLIFKRLIIAIRGVKHFLLFNQD